MRQKQRTTTDEQIEEKIRAAGTIGKLERLAGIEQSLDGRYAFWTIYSQLPGGQSLDAGGAELKRLIRAQTNVSVRQ